MQDSEEEHTHGGWQTWKRLVVVGDDDVWHQLSRHLLGRYFIESIAFVGYLFWNE